MMTTSTMNSACPKSARNPTQAKNPWHECCAQHRVHKPLSQSALRHKSDLVGVLTSQTLSQNRAEDPPLGIFNRLPYEVAENIWSSVAASTFQDPPTNLYRFKWPEKRAENPGSTQSNAKDLLALMVSSKAMHNDVFPILKRHMRDKTFNISFSESHGVQFESIRCTKPATVSGQNQDLTFSRSSSVCPNDALSAFARALPFIQYLNVTIELEYDDHLFGKPQDTLDSFIHHTYSLLSNIDTHTLEELNTNVRLHMDRISLQISATGKPTDIRINPPNRCPFNLYLHSIRNIRNWGNSTAGDAGFFMARAIKPLHRLARSRYFLGNSHHVTLSDGNCILRQDQDRLQTPPYRTWDMVIEWYFRTLKSSTPSHQKQCDPEIQVLLAKDILRVGWLHQARCRCNGNVQQVAVVMSIEGAHDA
jgi:hypothetical protein